MKNTNTAKIKKDPIAVISAAMAAAAMIGAAVFFISSSDIKSAPEEAIDAARRAAVQSDTSGSKLAPAVTESDPAETPAEKPEDTGVKDIYIPTEGMGTLGEYAPEGALITL